MEEKMEILKELLELVKEVKEIYNMNGYDAQEHVLKCLGIIEREENIFNCDVNVNISYKDVEKLDVEAIKKELVENIKRHQD